MDLSSVRPFEICSIRPPTENYSLTFRLTRNCYWNKCGFCPVYKFGARFSKRTIEAVKEDIRRAKLIDDLLFEQGIGSIPYAGYSLVTELVEKIKLVNPEAGQTEEYDTQAVPDNLDPGLAWFLSWFKDKPTLEDSLSHVLSWRMGGGKTCFMGDADSMILKPSYIAEAIDHIKMNFPSIQRFTVYGRTSSAARLRKLKELKAYRRAGIDRVHFGLESGSDTVLKFVNKGVTRDENIEGGLKAREAGLSCSVYVMPGLGGMMWSEEHAHDTADVLTKISPDYIRLRTLQIFPQTPLDEAQHTGAFMEASEDQVIKEIKIMLEEIDADTEIMSDSASNLLNINGRLPHERDAMLKEIGDYLALSKREKLIFSLNSRIRSFTGQYGGLSEDISLALAPFIKNGMLDVSHMSDQEIESITKMIRAKLMP